MAEIQTLELKIKAEGVSDSSRQINALKDALKKLADVAESVSAKINKIDFTGMDKLNEVVHDLASVDITNIQGMSDALDKLSRVNLSRVTKNMETLNHMSNANIGNPISTERVNHINVNPEDVFDRQDANEVSSILLDLKAEASDPIDVKIRVIGKDDIREAADDVKGMDEGFSFIEEVMVMFQGKLQDTMQKVGESLYDLDKRIKRIALIKMIRSAISGAVKSIKEGIDNAYQWSKSFGGSFAESMDKIKTATTYVKNSLGAAFIPILNLIGRSIDDVVDKVVDLINWFNKMISFLTGASTWTRAIKTQKEYAKAVGNTIKKLAGFDEINNIGGSSGSGGNDSSLGDFKEEVLDWVNDSWAANLQLTIQNVLFKWNNLNKEDIAQKLIAGFTTFMGFAAGGPVGALIGLAVGLLLDSVIFNNDGKIDGKEVMSTIVAGLAGLIGGFIGFAVGGVNGAVIGVNVALGLTFLLDKISTNFNYADSRRQIQAECEALGIDIHEGMKLGLQGTDADYQLIIDKYGDFGEAVVKGLQEGASREKESETSWWESLWDWFLNLFPKKAEIHSPSQVFFRYGEFLIQGLEQGVDTSKPSLLNSITTLMDEIKNKMSEKMTSIKNTLTEKWNGIKTWWSNLELSSFKIKTPHISWSSEPASGWISNVLSALGMPTSIPKMHVSWYDVGTNYVSEDQLAMIHKGEAIVPAKYNKDGAYQPANDETNDLLRELIDVIINKDMNAYIDGDSIGKASVKYINKQSRLMGVSVV